MGLNPWRSKHREGGEGPTNKKSAHFVMHQGAGFRMFTISATPGYVAGAWSGRLGRRAASMMTVILIRRPVISFATESTGQVDFLGLPCNYQLIGGGP